jgi:FMN-dependent NADH-azoreductase
VKVMAKVLYITAHPHDERQSYSMAVGKAFIDTYKEKNPNDEIVTIDLYKEHIPHIDTDVFSGWGKLRSGQSFEELSADEKAKVGRLSELSEQFVSGDKYVFVTPLWNFSFPPVMKAYLDSVAVAGKTFRYTAEGPVGLLTDKKALHIQARGGYYSEGPAAEMEMGHRYLNIMMNFFGVPSLEGLFIEGHNAEPEKAEEIKANAIERAKDLAHTF